MPKNQTKKVSASYKRYPIDARLEILESFYETKNYSECARRFNENHPGSKLNRVTISRMLKKFRKTGEHFV